MMTDVESGISGRHVVVTGASRGLGREMALALARAGARITGVALHESPQLHETLLRAEETSERPIVFGSFLAISPTGPIAHAFTHRPLNRSAWSKS